MRNFYSSYAKLINSLRKHDQNTNRFLWKLAVLYKYYDFFYMFRIHHDLAQIWQSRNYHVHISVREDIAVRVLNSRDLCFNCVSRSIEREYSFQRNTIERKKCNSRSHHWFNDIWMMGKESNLSPPTNKLSKRTDSIL